MQEARKVGGKVGPPNSAREDLAMATRRPSDRSDPKVDEVATRLQSHAREKWPQHGDVEVRRRGGFVYVSVCSGEEGPEPLCRLRNLAAQGEDLWEFSYYSHASEKYEPSLLPSGEPWGTLVECFDCAALTHVSDGPDDFAEYVRMKRAAESLERQCLSSTPPEDSSPFQKET